MRLQCRVTPAHSELLKQLEEIPEAYRSKRLVEMANMMAMMLANGILAIPQQVVIQPTQQLNSPASEVNNTDEQMSPQTNQKQDSEKQNDATPVEQKVHNQTNDAQEEKPAVTSAKPAPEWLRRSKSST